MNVKSTESMNVSRTTVGSIVKITSIIVAAILGTGMASQGQVITVPTDLNPGDEYRLVFVSSTTTTATSTDINTYNTFVNDLAITAGLDTIEGTDEGSTTWTAIGSTLSVNAIHNTSTTGAGTGIGIYLLNDTAIATSYADLWDSSLLSTPDVTEQGNATGNDGIGTWTGTGGSGVRYSSELGDTDGSVAWGQYWATNANWMRRLEKTSSGNARLYAMSGVLTVDAVPALVQTSTNTFDANAGNAALPAVAGVYAGDISATDLIDESQSTLLSNSVTAVTFGAGNLNDGAGSGDDLSVDTAFSLGQLPATATFYLNTNVNVYGYDLTNITTIAGWQKNGADLANQQYELYVSFVGDAGFTLVDTITYAPFTAAQAYNTGATKTELTDDTGIIASGVDAVRFVFLDPPESWNSAFDGSVYQEVDVFGVATGGAVTNDTIALTSLKDRQIVQRNLAGLAVLPVAGTFLGVGTEIQARAVAIGSNGVDTGWVTIDAAPSGGSYAGTLLLSEGWYLVEVRLLDGAEVLATASIDHVGVGDVYIVCGQSNSANFGDGTPSAADDRVSYMGLPSGTWTHADDPPENPSNSSGSNGSPWPKLGDLLSAEHNVPIGFVSIGDGSSSVYDWTPADNDNYPNLQTAVQSFGTNGFKAVLWHQGERDAGATTTSNYVLRLETVIAASRVDAGWDVPWGVAEVSYPSTNPPVPAAQRQVIANDPYVFAGANTDSLGAAYRNGAHFTAAGLVEHAALWFDALEAAFPALEMKGSVFSNPVATLSFAALIGEDYRVETTGNLTNSTWQLATDIVSATQSPYVVDITATNKEGFYRLKLMSE